MLKTELLLSLISEMTNALRFHKLPVTNRTLNILAQEEVLSRCGKNRIKALTEAEYNYAITYLRNWLPSADQYRKLRLEVHSNDSRTGLKS